MSSNYECEFDRVHFIYDRSWRVIANRVHTFNCKLLNYFGFSIFLSTSTRFLTPPNKRYIVRHERQSPSTQLSTALTLCCCIYLLTARRKRAEERRRKKSSARRDDQLIYSSTSPRVVGIGLIVARNDKLDVNQSRNPHHERSKILKTNRLQFELSSIILRKTGHARYGIPEMFNLFLF